MKQMIILNPINAAAFGSIQNSETISGFAATMPLKRDNPHPNDVICARGKRAFHHPGNFRFRQLIENQMELYQRAKTKIDKSMIVSLVIEDIRENSGVFIRQEDDHWVEVGDTAAREKVGQGLRDLLHSKYRSSTKAKKVRKITSLTTDVCNSQHDEDTSNVGDDQEYDDQGRSDVSSVSEVNERVQEKTLNYAASTDDCDRRGSSFIPILTSQGLRLPIDWGTKSKAPDKDSAIPQLSSKPIQDPSLVRSRPETAQIMDTSTSEETDIFTSSHQEFGDTATAVLCPPSLPPPRTSSCFEPVAINEVFSRNSSTSCLRASFVAALNELMDWD